MTRKEKATMDTQKIIRARVGCEWDDGKQHARPFRIVNGWAIVTWRPESSQWECASAGDGYGVGRTPEAAIRAAAWDGGGFAWGYKTRAKAEAEIAAQRLSWEY